TVQGFGRHVSKHLLRQTELVDALQFGDFLEYAFQTEGTDILFECMQSRLGTWRCAFLFLGRFCCSFVTRCARISRWGFLPCLGDINSEQRIELCACLWRELL